MMSLEKKKKVMVAIDESEFSYYALDWALQHLNLSGSDSDSDLLLFTVQSQFDLNYVYPCTFGAAPPELIRNIQENQKKVALALLDKAKEICSKHGIIPETMTEVGDPKEAICEAVEKLNIQLLVMGSHGRGSVKRAFLGSVSNYCVHNVKCPVLVVKKPVSVQAPSSMEHVKFIEERQKKAALRMLENAMAVCKTYRIDAEGMTEVGDPKEAICRAIVKYNVQLLVIGSHGHGALKRAFLGSVSYYCVHHAECPVLVVRRDSN